MAGLFSSLICPRNESLYLLAFKSRLLSVLSAFPHSIYQQNLFLYLPTLCALNANVGEYLYKNSTILQGIQKHTSHRKT